MAGNIKGITIEFRGDTTNLQKALRQVNSETAKIDKELKNVNKSLKFNPTSVDLWKEKQVLLTKKVQETEDKVKLLKQAQKQMDTDGVEKTSQEYMQLQREIVETESKLKTFKGQLKEVGSPQLKATSAQFDALGTSLTNAGEAMKGFSAAGAAVLATMGALAVKSGQWADDLNTMSKVYSISTEELQKYSLAAELIDVDVETIAGSHVKLTKSMSSAADETSEQAEAFKKLGIEVTDANGELRNADDVWQEVIQGLGKLENETERDALAMQLLGKSAMQLNPLIEDNGETFKDLAETLEKYNLDFIDQETLDKANEFNDKIDTIKAIGTLTWQSLGATLADKFLPILEKVVDWVGNLADYIQGMDPIILTIIATIAGVVAVIAPLLIIVGKLAFAISSIMNLASTLGPILAGVSAPILPIIAAIAAAIAIGVLLYKNWDTIKAKAIEIWTKVSDFFVKTWESIKTKATEAWEGIKEFFSSVWEGIKAVAETVWGGIKWYFETMLDWYKTIFTSVWNGISGTVMGIWNGIKRQAEIIWNTIKMFVEDPIGAIKYFLENTWNNIKDTATRVWDSIAGAITGPIEKAKEIISSIIEKIKNFFPFNVGKILNLKLPHFSVTGGEAPWGIGGKGSLPKLSVDWYKTGGIFKAPSIIGVGEAGAEAVVPLDKFWGKLDKLSTPTVNITVTVNGAEDPEAWARKLVRQMQTEMRML